MQQKILVTGGCGFVGANLVPQLLQQGYDVRVVDNLSKGNPEYLADLPVTLIIGDIRDRKLMIEACEGIDIVIHLAAYGSVVESVTDPSENFSVNVQGTFELLNACRTVGVRRMLFASTGGAIIGNAEPPVDETTLPKPISPYGASKLCGEAYCHAFGISYGISTTSLRFANLYGPFSQHKRGAVTMFIKAIREGKPIVIFGDGTASRDFIFVEDLCRGIINTLDVEAPFGAAYHFASERETSVRELAEILIEVAGKVDHPIEMFPARRGEVERNFANASRAKKDLNFRADMDLKEGMSRTWQWFLENT